LSTRVVDAVATAEGVQAVPLARMQLPRQRQRVHHAAQVAHAQLQAVHAGQLRIEEADVEYRVVDHQLGATDELEQLLDHVGEPRLAGQELVGDAVDRERPGIHFPVRTEVTVERPPGGPPVVELDAADLDHSMALADLEAGGFGVQDDLAHGGG